MIGPTSTPIPAVIIMDSVTGYAVNIPVTEQDYPYWWIDKPDAYARIRQLRKDMDITIVDFPNGVSQPPTEKPKIVPMKTTAELDAQT